MKIGIIGLGLIGGSLGLDLSLQGIEVRGVSRRQQTCDQALEMGVVAQASISLTLLKGVDILFICTPIGAIIPTIGEVIPHLSSETIITDVGSVKLPIVEAIAPLWPNFVGGHPMAGTAEKGIEAAQKNLFNQAAYVLTPTEITPATSIDKIEQVIALLNARLHLTTPEKHDRAVALISHLSVMISASLINTCLNPSNQDVLDLAQKLASSGFRDTSRVGGGNPELGVMMAEYNRSSLLSSLYQYRHSLEEIIQLIESNNWQKLEVLLQSNKVARPLFL